MSFNTLAPIATAGIPVDDLFTLPGGRLQRTRLELEWRQGPGLTSAWVCRREIRNIAFDPLTGPDNGGTELADLSCLDAPSLLSLPLDLPEGLPRFSEREIEEWGLSHERLLSDEVSLRIRHRGADSENTGWISGNELPFVPRHECAAPRDRFERQLVPAGPLGAPGASRLP